MKLTANNREIPLEWLVSPVRREKMTAVEGNTLSCSEGIYRKHEKSGYWNFIPANLEKFDKAKWDAWNNLQYNATIPYQEHPERNLGVGPRQDYIEFGRFCKYRGIVLDIGVGPQKHPTHVQYLKSQNFDFIGIDPLVGEQPREFKFIQGLGEYLPFRNELFDQALFVTSLDHFIDPVVALLEAKRVVKQDGEICVWLGEKDKNAPTPKENPEWYKKLRIPEGAEDPFHFKRFSINEFKGYLDKAKLKIVEEEFHVVDEWRKNCFYQIKKKSA